VVPMRTVRIRREEESFSRKVYVDPYRNPSSDAIGLCIIRIYRRPVLLVNMANAALERLGEHQFETREGFLFIKGVPLARTGVMEYVPGEIYDHIRRRFIPGGPDGKIYSHASADDLFTPETIESIRGKAVVIGHPDGDVTPDNWTELSVGFVMDPRREGGENDYDMLVGDLMVTHPEAIPRVKRKPEEGGLREVSCGYDADYEEDTSNPGHVRRHKLLYNHVALLPVGLGRCGSTCSIGDSKSVHTEDCKMSVKERLKKLFDDKDERGFTAALDEIDERPVTLTTDQLKTVAQFVRTSDAEKEEHEKGCDCAKCKDRKTMDAIAQDVKSINDKVSGLDARMKKIEDEKEEKNEKEDKEIEGRLEEEAPPGSGDKAKKAKDSSYLVEAWQDTVSYAEAISPGISIPTIDAAAAPKQTLDRMCNFRRTALELGYNRPELRQFIDGVLGGREPKALTCDQMRPIFKAAGQYAMSLNNRSEAARTTTSNDSKPKRLTLADVNKMNREFYEASK
jgi:hypothetical protein